MKKIFYSLIYCLVFLTFCSATSIARETLVVAFEPYPPYEEIVDNTPQGINIDILREACRRMDIKPELRAMSWQRALFELREGRVDAVSSGFNSADRQTYAYFPRFPLSNETLVIAARKDSDISLGSLNDIRRYKIGVVRQHSYGEEFDSMRGLDKDYSNNVESQLDKLMKKRTDLIVGNQLVFRYLQNRRQEATTVKVLLTFQKKPLYVFFSRALGDRGRELSDNFSETLEEMFEDGTVLSIYKKYHISD